jgi:hypothetical protein
VQWGQNKACSVRAASLTATLPQSEAEREAEAGRRSSLGSERGAGRDGRDAKGSGKKAPDARAKGRKDEARTSDTLLEEFKNNKARKFEFKVWPPGDRLHACLPPPACHTAGLHRA